MLCDFFASAMRRAVVVVIFEPKVNRSTDNRCEIWIFSHLQQQRWIGGRVFWFIFLNQIEVSSVSHHLTESFELVELTLVNLDHFTRLSLRLSWIHMPDEFILSFKIEMQDKKPRRIDFKICHCSSEDPQYPASELLLQSPEAKGWLSKRFSDYPQMIVLELDRISALGRIAVLSHQSKIATRMEIEVKTDESEGWRKLGHISFDSNTNTNYQAREFKQASLNSAPARFVRITFRNHHINKHNMFNQIGIISFSIYGEEYQGKPRQPAEDWRADRQEKGDPSSGNPQIQMRIRELQGRKVQAVKNQQFDIAKNLKEEIDRLKTLTLTINSLEDKKKQAIRQQAYEDAKLFNMKIKQLKEQLFRSNEAQQQQPPNYQQAARAERPAPVKPPSKNAFSRQQAPQVQKKEIERKPEPINSGDYLEKPIRVKNSNPYGQGNQAEEQPTEQKQTSLQPLSKQIYSDCSQHFGILSEEIMQHVFSTNHMLRSKGVDMIFDELENTREREAFISACLYVVRQLIDDKTTSVLSGAMELLISMMKKLKPQANSHNQSLVEYILDKIADYLGHNNDKIKILAEDCFSNFPIYHLTSKDTCYRALIAPSKREKPPKIIVGRLKMLNRLVKEYQLGRDQEEVIKYAVKYADDKNNEVRAHAISLICELSFDLSYNAIQPFLKNLRPPILKSIEEKLEEGGEQLQTPEERPIKTGLKGKGNQQFESQGNEFIEMPKKKVSSSNEDITCQFCGKVDRNFINEDYIDMHHYNACKMLTICKECNQATQICTLTAHMVGQCKNSKYFKKCPRCKEAVSQKNYKSHVEQKECLTAKPLASNNRCPLCHLDINAGASGWKEHLVDEGCQNNPRG